MKKIAVYARVSSDEQADRGTIENQIEFATKYCDLHQLEIVEWYKDDGVTGTLPLELRPAGEKLLSDAKAGKFNLLLIYKLDRLGRATRVVLNAVYELEQNGIKVRSMTEPFDTDDASGKFLLTILAGVADLERSNILDRMWHGANRAARSGKWLGGIVPYGYFVNEEGFLQANKDLIPNTPLVVSESGIVQLIFSLMSKQKKSCIKIADYLNALGIPTHYVRDGRLLKRGKRKENTAGIWRPGRIRTIVVNTTYKGVHYYGKRSSKSREIIPREVPAIVSEEIWEEANRVLKENQLEAVKNSKTKYLLRGLIKCGACGLNYTGVNYKNSKPYYTCNGKNSYQGPLLGKCTAKNIPQHFIEKFIWRDCINFIQNPGEALKQMDIKMEEKKSRKEEFEKEKSYILISINDKEQEKQSILDLYRRKIITMNDLESQLQKIDIEKSFLLQKLGDLEVDIRSQETTSEQFESAEQLLNSLLLKINKEELTFEVKREIIKALVEKVVVDTKINEETNKPYASITVHYNFSSVVNYTDKDCNKPIKVYWQENDKKYYYALF